MTSHQLTRSEAEEFIELHQRQRNDFIRRFADGQPDDPHLYHLVINNARFNVEKMADLVDDFLLKKNA